jgi:protein dithiol oxidoreductase (disulfide-forming)
MQQRASRLEGSESGVAQLPGGARMRARGGRRWPAAILALAMLATCGLTQPSAAVFAADDANWVAGTNYVVLQPAQPTSVGPGKVEVTEVFSYACPACNAFHETVDKLRASLPANAVLDFVAAGFIPSEDWPMFQRAYYTAQELRLLSPRVHDAMFDAVWKSGELAVVVPNTDRLKEPPPSMQDAAQFYAHETGVSAAKFLAASQSFAVNLKVRQADQYIEDCGVDQTPTLIVNGKYRLTPATAGGYDQLIALVKWLVAKESGH